jgi:hypothetical protein
MAILEAWKSKDDPDVWSEVRANAALIAAAPEMLEALEHVMNNLMQESAEVWEHEISHLKYAIDKAKNY